MKRWLPFGLLGIGVVLVVYALFFISSDEDRIRARLAQLADVVRVVEGENPLVRHGRIRKEFAEIFAKEASVSVPRLADSVQGRDALAAAATQVAGVYQFAAVSLGDVSLQIDRSGMVAEATATATVTGARRGQPVRRDERRVKLQLEKIEGDWKVTSVVVEPRGGPEDDGL